MTYGHVFSARILEPQNVALLLHRSAHGNASQWSASHTVAVGSLNDLTLSNGELETLEELGEMGTSTLPKPINSTKIYIMAVPATGKSTFAHANEHYKNVRIVDFSEIASKEARNRGRTATSTRRRNLFRRLAGYLRRKMLAVYRRVIRGDGVRGNASTGKTYHEEAISYLRSQNGPVVVLGRVGPPNPERFPDIVFAAVLIPEEEHRRNCRQRKIRYPNSKMADFSKVDAIRRQLSEYAKSHDIPVYTAFKSALDELIEINAIDR